MAAKKRKANKVRTEFRKRHDTRTRKRDYTRDFTEVSEEERDDSGIVREERVSGKGSLTRKRTIVGDLVEDELSGAHVQREIDLSECVPGRVLSLHGLSSYVLLEDGRELSCATRGVLKSLSSDQRNVVVAGDAVWVRPISADEGVIERVEPRHGIISRSSRHRQHVLVANVDRMLIVMSAAEPTIKPNLIDRFLVTAEKAKIQPIICLNKIDLIDPADLQPLAGVFGQMGYPILFTSATTKQGMEDLKAMVIGHQSVVAGQSGVGKSSLLNDIEPGLNLKVSTVSEENQKGRHTTTAARLFPLTEGGYIVDTPGIRQFELWDVIPAEVSGFFRDLRPYVSLCRFPDCTHTHEDDCAIKDAVADGRLDARRYESYCQMFAGESPGK